MKWTCAQRVLEFAVNSMVFALPRVGSITKRVTDAVSYWYGGREGNST